MRAFKILPVFAVLMMTLSLPAVADDYIIIELPQRFELAPNAGKYNDSFILNTYSGRLLFACNRAWKSVQQRVAGLGIMGINVDDKSSFPVSTSQHIICSAERGDVYTLHPLAITSFQTPIVEGIDININALKPFVYMTTLKNSAREQNVNPQYFNGCPRNPVNLPNNYYLTSTRQCSDICPAGSPQREIKVNGAVTAFILCDDKGAKEAEEEKKKEEDTKENEAICAAGNATGTFPNCVCNTAGQVWTPAGSRTGNCVTPSKPVPQDEKNCKGLGPQGAFGTVFTWDSTAKICKCINGFPLVVVNNTGSCPDPNQAAMEACNKVGPAVATWDAAAKTCNCVDKNFDWNGSACVKKPGVQAEEDAQKCRDGGGEWDTTNKKCDCSKKGKGYEWNGSKCELTQDAVVADLTTSISNTFDNLNNTMDSFGRSQWKNAEGKFNTARLISDSVAGAALGTVGGLVTHTIIKKNQLKKGFDGIHCSVDGETVADFGDEFRVGVR
ncbi:MAG: hypothetical protein FWF97_03360 [Alphaproteobacteria bacterium]|nr:hypothetical protein [Alphaproteobacteria bacterium]